MIEHAVPLVLNLTLPPDTAAAFLALVGGSIDAEALKRNLDAMRGAPKPFAPSEDAFDALEAQILDLIEVLCDPRFTKDHTKTASAMLCFAKDGYCNASQLKIAKKGGIPQTTVHRVLMDFQAWGIMRRWECTGHSDVCVFADGMKDAYRRKKALGLRPHKRRHPKVKRTFKTPQLVRDMVLDGTPVPQGNPAKKAIQPESTFSPNPESKIPTESITLSASQYRVQDATHPKHTPSLVFSENPKHTTLCVMPYKSNENEVTTEPEISRCLPASLPETAVLTEPLAQAVPEMTGPETSTSHTGDTTAKEGEKTDIVSVLAELEQSWPAPSPRQESPQETLVALLIAERVTDSRAGKLFREFGADRVSRNLALGTHRSADNPPGYLCEAIKHDYAATARGNRPIAPTRMPRPMEAFPSGILTGQEPGQSDAEEEGGNAKALEFARLCVARKPDIPVDKEAVEQRAREASAKRAAELRAQSERLARLDAQDRANGTGRYAPRKRVFGWPSGVFRGGDSGISSP